MNLIFKILLLCSLPLFSFCQVRYVATVIRYDTSNITLKYKNKLDINISEISFRKISRRQVKKIFTPRRGFMGLFGYLTNPDDINVLKKYLIISERVQDSTVKINEVFEYIKDTTPKTEFFVDCDPFPCPQYYVTKYVSDKKEWTYYGKDYDNIDNFKHWYELYCLKIKKTSQNREFQFLFDKNSFYWMTLNFFEKLKN